MDARSQVENVLQSWLGGERQLDRDSCITILQAVSLTLPEANAIVKDFGAERSQISLKDFLDIFFPRQEPLDMATPSAAENGEVVTSLDDSLQADNEMLKRELQETQANNERLKKQLQEDHKQVLFMIEVDKASGERLGIVLKKEDHRPFRVKDIKDGLVQKWNLKHPDKAVRLGDWIVEVNGLRDVEQITMECQRDQVLTICVQRPLGEQDLEDGTANGGGWATSAPQGEDEALVDESLQAENGRLKKALREAQAEHERLLEAKMQAEESHEVEEVHRHGAHVTLYITLKDQPAVTADTADIAYHGHIREGATRCVISFPGKYPSGWDALIKEHHDGSVGCVFLCTPEDGLGKHAQDPDAEEGTCYCKAIYGERGWKEFGYLKVLRWPYTKEKMLKEQEKAAAMGIVVVGEDASPEERQKAEQEAEQKYEENQRRAPWGCFWFKVWMGNGTYATEKKQKLQVVYFAGQKGKGKVEWEALATSDLWDGIGLGGSQKSEVAFLDRMRQKDPAWDYEEVDVALFLQNEFSLEQEVDAWDPEISKWRRGRLVAVPEWSEGCRDSPMEWMLVCKENQQTFRSTHLRHTTDPIHRLIDSLNRVEDDGLTKMLENALPEGIHLMGTPDVQCRLPNGNNAVGVKVHVPHIKAIHLLRDRVLSGDFDTALNEYLATSEYLGELEVQVDKTEFFERYERSLLSLSKLTEHQESKLQQLHEANSKELHLSAPAGAGKTFVAVQFALDKVYENWNSKGRILYVAPRPALGLHFVQWLIARHQALGIQEGFDANVEELLARVVLMHEPYNRLISLHVGPGGRLEETLLQTHVAAIASSCFLSIFDEAHELFASDQMSQIYRDAPGEKLLLSDLSQSASLHPSFPKDATTVTMTEVVRSTKRIVAGAQAFQIRIDGVSTSCSGTEGPPLKTFMFNADAQEMKTFDLCSLHIVRAIWHILRSFPSLKSLHRRVAIIVPDQEFLEKLMPLLAVKLQSTFAARKLQLVSFEGSLRYLHHYQQEVTSEVLVLDTIESARGLEMMMVICAGLDEPISETGSMETLVTRARIYQGITRAQLMTVIVDRFVPGGWLEFLQTLKFKEKLFQESSAFAEVSPEAAGQIVQKQGQAVPSAALETLLGKEKLSDRKKSPVMLKAKVVAKEEGSDTEPLEANKEDEQLPEEEKEEEGEEEAVSKAIAPTAPTAPPLHEQLHETSIWDTDSNEITSRSQALRFDPRQAQTIDQTGKITDYYQLDKKKLASVYTATNISTKVLRAVKAMSKSKRKTVERSREEIAIVRRMRHPHVIQLYETFEDHRNIYLVMELCSGGELFDRILESGSFSEAQASVVMEQILRAVDYMHKNRVCHRDLKPEHCLFKTEDPIEKNILKIIDFGSASNFTPDEPMRTKIGTPHYVAPHVIVGKYNEKCDLWSCGVIMYVLLLGYTPFYGDTDAEVLSKVRLGNFSFNAHDSRNISQDAKGLIRWLLKMNPNARCTAEEALNHTWIKLKPFHESSAMDFGLLENLRHFRATDRLTKAALHTISSQLNADQIKALRETFHALDQNSDGQITRHDLKEGLLQAGLKEIPADLLEIMEAIDPQDYGPIDYTEFLAKALDRRFDFEEDVCWSAFRDCDQNGDGKVFAHQMKPVLENPEVTGAFGASALGEVLKEVESTDGMIDFEEFLTMMRATGEKS